MAPSIILNKKHMYNQKYSLTESIFKYILGKLENNNHRNKRIINPMAWTNAMIKPHSPKTKNSATSFLLKFNKFHR